jgi:hypothetical protein
MTVRVPSLVGNEHAIGIRDEMDEVEPLDDLAIRPTTAEVRLTVEPIVERTRKMKILGDELLEDGLILCHVGLIGGSRDRNVGCRVLYSLSGHELLSLARDIIRRRTSHAG